MNILSERGQTSLPEYVLLLFIVIAFATAITVYAQRGLQARIVDARNYAVNQARSECGPNCMKATGDYIGREYEPYYGHIESRTDRATEDLSSIEGGVSKKEGIYRKMTDIATSTNTVSWQKPPKDAN